jgi:hypothetical protein
VPKADIGLTNNDLADTLKKSMSARPAGKGSIGALEPGNL